jgi:hypothetical protein
MAFRYYKYIFQELIASVIQWNLQIVKMNVQEKFDHITFGKTVSFKTTIERMLFSHSYLTQVEHIIALHHHRLTCKYL